MSKKDVEQEDDLELFQQAMADVIPIQTDRVQHSHKKNARKPSSSSPQARKEQRERFSTEQAEECDVILSFSRPGVQKTTFKKLRSGKFEPEASLDLHGFTVEQARTALIDYLDYCTKQQLRTVCVVHGKGFGSSQKKAVIKPMVNKWLQEADEVLAFCSAQPKDGGTGSVYLLLKLTNPD